MLIQVVGGVGSGGVLDCGCEICLGQNAGKERVLRLLSWTLLVIAMGVCGRTTALCFPLGPWSLADPVPVGQPDARGPDPEPP